MNRICRFCFFWTLTKSPPLTRTSRIGPERFGHCNSKIFGTINKKRKVRGRGKKVYGESGHVMVILPKDDRIRTHGNFGCTAFVEK